MSNRDITRSLRQPKKHYFAARLQQGRTLVDSDVNEYAELSSLDRQQAILAMLGGKASPAQGFAVGTPLAQGPYQYVYLRALNKGDRVRVDSVLLGDSYQYVHAVSILPGSLYLGGLRFEQIQAEHIAMQRGYLQMKVDDGLFYLTGVQSPSPESPHSPRLVYSPSSPSSPYEVLDSPDSPNSPESPTFPTFRNFYYLNAWEQAVTAIEDEELLEHALGGPDTTVRIRRMHRVEVLGNLAGRINSCSDAFEELIRILEANNGKFDRETYELKSTGRLQLKFQEPSSPNPCGPCNFDPDARYLGDENHALRIMLTTSRTYVWAFDNAAPLYRVKVTGLSSGNPSDVRVKMLTPPKDAFHFPRRNQVVEILPFAAVLDRAERLKPDHPHFQKLAAEMGAFVRVAADYDPVTQTFSLETALGYRIQRLKQFVTNWSEHHPAAQALNMRDPDGDGRYFYMRVWHTAESEAEIELRTSDDENGEPLGRTGIVPLFRQAGRAGDTWLATLRLDQPYRIVPYDLLTEEKGVPPHGPRHYYAPLSFIRGHDEDVSAVDNCKKAIKRVTERSCATRTVGDGFVSFGDYKHIQDAIDSLPVEGGTILILPGEYRESVVIEERGNVTLVGCGDATVLEPLRTRRPIAPVIAISRTDRVSIANLSIHAIGTAISGELSSNLSLSQLTLRAGSLGTSGVFERVVRSSGADLVSISNVTQLQLTALALEAGPRCAISLSSVNGGRILGLQNGGENDNELVVPNGAYIQLSTVQGMTFSDSDLGFRGREGVATGGVSDLRLHHLMLTGDSLDVGTATVQAYPVLSLGDSSHAVEISECHLMLRTSTLLSTSSVVSLAGSDVLLEDNTIEVIDTQSDSTTLPAYGGIWIRSRSTDIEVRNNRIEGGYGHGITLGSVTWTRRGRTLSPHPGPGAGSMTVLNGSVAALTGDTTGDLAIGAAVYRADLDPGSLDRITIVENHVSNLGTNGISVLSLFGLSGGDTYVLQDLVIERNTVCQNLSQIQPVIPVRTNYLKFLASAADKGKSLLLPILPLGGIVLSVVNGSCDIRGNAITDNRYVAGASDAQLGLPVNGIFILAGDDISICDNRLSDNGSRLPASVTELAGVRAAIAVVLAGVGRITTAHSLSSVVNSSSPDSVEFSSSKSALRVFNNTARHPEGRALLATSYGPTAVFGNFFSSDGHRGAEDTYTPPLRHLSDGEQTDATLVGDVVFVESLAIPWERYGTIPAEHVPSESANDTSAVTPVAAVDSELQGFQSGWYANGRGGHLMFHSNQVAFAWDQVQRPTGAVVSYYPVGLVGIDHVGVHGNQLDFRVAPDAPAAGDVAFTGDASFYVATPLVTQLFASAHTVSVSHNRFSESLNATLYSAVGFSRFLGCVACNQGSHPCSAFGPEEVTNQRIHQFGNQILYGWKNGYPPGTDTTKYSMEGARSFFERQFKIVKSS